ncbi:MAG TPA: hypothetical protein PKA42_02800 [Candidatus Paceibacterota bacterium]|nr:hypothetical protein [Candidatus Paceibacterota bacterium]HMO83074.1 hypothetical protein [Candidatus Paceibacterota bacterium]
MRKKYEISKILTVFLGLLIIFSLTLMYKVLMIDRDYEIFTNPDGPDTSDYFEDE